jgi:hypothetical protein
MIGSRLENSVNAIGMTNAHESKVNILETFYIA